MRSSVPEQVQMPEMHRQSTTGGLPEWVKNDIHHQTVPCNGGHDKIDRAQETGTTGRNDLGAAIEMAEISPCFNRNAKKPGQGKPARSTAMPNMTN